MKWTTNQSKPPCLRQAKRLTGPSGPQRRITMPNKKRITKTLYIHRKPGREDVLETCDMTRSGVDSWGVEHYGVMIGAVEATIEYTDIDADPTDALVAALEQQLTQERAESHTRQANIQQRINELLAITHQSEGDL